MRLLSLFHALLAALSFHAAAETPLTVSAATSLRLVLTEIKALYLRERADVAITLDIAGSGTIQRKIEGGAPVDVFISASPKEVFALQKKDLLVENSIRNVARNTLVLIVPKHNTTIHAFADLTKPEVRRIAIGDPLSVSAGTYATAVLSSLKLTDELAPKIAPLPDVQQVVTEVGTGVAEAGIVYITDARVADKVRIAATAAPDTHQFILYPCAIPKSSPQQAAARDFCAFLLSPEAQATFLKHGFLPPP